jgi:hypothetical protein
MTRIIIEAESTEEALHLATALDYLFVATRSMDEDTRRIVLDVNGMVDEVEAVGLEEFLRRWWLPSHDANKGATE